MRPPEGPPAAGPAADPLTNAPADAPTETPEPDPATVQRAAEWMARLWSGEASAADQAACAAWRAARLPMLSRFPTGGEWRGSDGAAMTPADWEAPGAGIVSYATDRYGFVVDRPAGTVTFAG